MKAISTVRCGGESSKLSEREYVLDKCAAAGELTAFWAKPGSGKTLLTIHMLIASAKAGRLDGKKVCYINADDSLAGMVQKAEICAQYGITMQVPGLYGFSNEKFFKFVDDSIAYGNAKGYVLILDTLKNFMDTTDKKECTVFMAKMRDFCNVGGTVIMLGRANKNPQTGRKPICSGVSYVSYNSDAYSYITASGPKFGVTTAKLCSKKKRLGDGGSTFFRFNGGLTGEDRTYKNLLSSVQEISIEQGELGQKTGTSGRQEYKLNETEDIFPETIKEETGEWL